MADICSNPIGPALCAKTCHSCQPATTVAVDTCKDHDSICSTMVGICNNPIGPTLCAKTCHACPTATPSTTTTTPTTQPNTTTPTPSATTITTPTTPSAATTTPTAPSITTITTPPAPSTTSISTGKAIERLCFQCGNADTATYCTISETIMPNSYPCTQDKGFCMTDVYQHTDTTTKFIRRCVNETTCNRQWYEQTSGNSECVDVDPTTVSSAITCSYCCTTDNCNSLVVPDRHTLYKPKP
ncbi:integumentary mucin A.1-like [Haliotis cracherodii]|uniref:integumentary mucin A.1-like n=1 Tax=Haliotis cracherodii TaxID=6455 RepID=UPI0039ED2E74